MASDDRKGFWPRKGDGPSTLEVVIIILFAALVVLGYFLWKNTADGRDHPVVEEPAGAAEHRHIAQPRE